MHEMSIAMNIVKIACNEAEKDGAPAITRIELEVGTLSGVMMDSLKFCYDSACRGTLAEGSSLVIHEVKAEAFCRTCEHVFEVDAFMALCPECQGYAIEIRKGRELKLKAISVPDN